MRTICVGVVVLALSASASAQQLTLQFQDGRVTVDAAGVPVRTILSEWARLGGTRVVGGEKVAGAPVTIRLENVPEAQALEIILRNVAGYMAAPRRADSTGASAYDRILVLPTSSAPAAASASAGTRANGNGNNANALNGTQRGVRGGFIPPPPTEEQQAVAEEPDPGVNQPPFSFPAPGQNPFQAAGQPTPFGTPVAPGAEPPVVQFGPFGAPAQGGQAVTVNPTPQQPTPFLQFPGMAPAGPAPGTTGGFGIIGAPTPGVVTQPAAPGQPVRPPGGN
ncbi:MAG: hypothetical protein IT177_09600 [Acidobacteria bacterium]|nr:hypothetical protein [Acidobacteriota bacterium]